MTFQPEPEDQQPPEFGEPIAEQPIRIPLQATLTLDLDGLWPHPTESLSDYAEDGPAPTSNRDELITAVAQQLANRLYQEFFPSYTQRQEIKKVIDAKVDELIGDAVVKVLNEDVQPSTVLGQPTGAKRPLIEHVAEKAAEWLTAPDVNRYGEKTGKGSKLDGIIAEHVGNVWTRELNAAVKAAKDRVEKVVAERAATQLATSITGLAEQLAPPPVPATPPPTPNPNEF